MHNEFKSNNECIDKIDYNIVSYSHDSDDSAADSYKPDEPLDEQEQAKGEGKRLKTMSLAVSYPHWHYKTYKQTSCKCYLVVL